MCCQDTFRIRAGLTWAIPIDITVFGPHLQAYLTLKPLLTSIRLCHRFGQGPEAHITKLPIELFDEIIEYLISFERSRIALDGQWKYLFRCFESRCSPTDHFDANELELYRWELRELLHVENITNEAVESYIHEQHSEKMAAVCEARRVGWVNKVQQKPCRLKTYCPTFCQCGILGFDRFDQVSYSILTW
jgi:hypothetical protein